jgi:hypothetical protein
MSVIIHYKNGIKESLGQHPNVLIENGENIINELKSIYEISEPKIMKVEVEIIYLKHEDLKYHTKINIQGDQKFSIEINKKGDGYLETIRSAVNLVKNKVREEKDKRVSKRS